MWASLFGALLDFINRTVMGWVKEEQVKANEWAAKTREGMLKSIKSTEALTKGMEGVAKTEADAKRADTPDNWNKQRHEAGIKPIATLALALMVVFGASGCQRIVFVESRWPMLTPPERPEVPTDPPEWTPRERILKNYAENLEATINVYNREAEKHNNLNGY
jgi:hypothetical protein